MSNNTAERDPTQSQQTRPALDKQRAIKAIDRSLERGEFFVAYLTNFPSSLNINHGVLVYAARKNGADPERYLVYDSNHPDGPRTLEWSDQESCFLYQRDTDFVGGKVVVWQVYGTFLQ